MEPNRAAQKLRGNERLVVGLRGALFEVIAILLDEGAPFYWEGRPFIEMGAPFYR
jgi:hypothetical protein